MVTLNPVSAHSRDAYVLLTALADEDGQAVRELLDRLPGVSESAVEPLTEQLERLGLVSTTRTFGGLYASLTPSGKHEAARAREQSERRRVRVRFAQDPLLRWLYEEIEEHGRHPTPESFASTSPQMFGQSITEEEVLRAAALLAEAGFIAGPGAFGRSAPIRPELTAKGRYTVEHDRSVHDPLPTYGSQTITNVNAPSNVAVQSSHVTQTMTVSDAWAGELTSLLDLIADQRTAPDADGLVEVARGELKGERRPHVLRSTLEKLRDEVPKVTSSVVASVVTNGLTSLVASI